MSASDADSTDCSSLSGLPTAVYSRAVAAFARGAGDSLFLPAASLEAAARDVLGPLFSARRFAFFAPRAAARWPRGLALGAFDIFVGLIRERDTRALVFQPSFYPVLPVLHPCYSWERCFRGVRWKAR